jgi:hypothetical protein
VAHIFADLSTRRASELAWCWLIDAGHRSIYDSDDKEVGRLTFIDGAQEVRITGMIQLTYPTHATQLKIPRACTGNPEKIARVMAAAFLVNEIFMYAFWKRERPR